VILCRIMYINNTDLCRRDQKLLGAKVFEPCYRVTRLGEFSPIGWLFTLGGFVEFYRRALICGTIFPTGEVVHWFWPKKSVGLHLGPFFHKLVWSHWPCRTTCTGSRTLSQPLQLPHLISAWSNATSEDSPSGWLDWANFWHIGWLFTLWKLFEKT
jgi:hypothetical protein